MQVVKAKPRQLLPLGTPDPGSLSDNEHTSQALNTFIMEEKNLIKMFHILAYLKISSNFKNVLLHWLSIQTRSPLRIWLLFLSCLYLMVRFLSLIPNSSSFSVFLSSHLWRDQVVLQNTQLSGAVSCAVFSLFLYPLWLDLDSRLKLSLLLCFWEMARICYR